MMVDTAPNADLTNMTVDHILLRSLGTGWERNRCASQEKLLT
jgi:hypothetical protein